MASVVVTFLNTVSATVSVAVVAGTSVSRKTSVPAPPSKDTEPAAIVVVVIVKSAPPLPWYVEPTAPIVN